MQVINSLGHTILLRDWQSANHLPKDKVANYFSINELDCEGELTIAVPLLQLLDTFRTRLNRPIKINSAYRSSKKQEQLRAQGYRTALISPHTKGMAADIDTTNYTQTLAYVHQLKQCAKDLNLKIRLGYNEYHKAGQSFIHVDVCPMYYAPGKPYHKVAHPPVWEKEIEW